MNEFGGPVGTGLIMVASHVVVGEETAVGAGGRKPGVGAPHLKQEGFDPNTVCLHVSQNQSPSRAPPRPAAMPEGGGRNRGFELRKLDIAGVFKAPRYCTATERRLRSRERRVLRSPGAATPRLNSDGDCTRT